MKEVRLEVMFAMLMLTIIEVVAIVKGMNGTLMIIMCSAIAGLGGWVIPNPFKSKTI